MIFISRIFLWPFVDWIFYMSSVSSWPCQGAVYVQEALILKSLADDVRTPFRPNAHFIFRVDIPPLSYSKGHILHICIVGISHSQGPVKDEVRSLAAVLARGIVRIASNSQSETTIKACKHPQSVSLTKKGVKNAWGSGSGIKTARRPQSRLWARLMEE